MHDKVFLLTQLTFTATDALDGYRVTDFLSDYL